MRILTLITLLALSFSVTAAPKPATPKQLTAIKKSLDKELMDAQSARLIDVLVEGNNFCGLVNAKNAMGAYIGYRPMYGMVFVDKTGSTLAVTMSIDQDGVTDKMCEQVGLPLAPR